MATDLATPSNTLAKVRWREQYVSEGLNRKLNGLVPAGVIRGGRLGTSLLDLRVTVEADPGTGDSIYSHIDSNGIQLTFRQVGDIVLDLTALASTTVYVGLAIVYATSADTEVYWRAYSQAEIDADPTIICLGQVDVPASGLIPESDISGDRRTNAGLSISAGMREWHQIVKNPSFEGYEVSASGWDYVQDFPHWAFDPGGNGEWHVLTPTSTPTADPRVGSNNLAFVGSGAGAASPAAYYDRVARVAPGQMVRPSVWVRGDTVTMGGGGSSIAGILLTVFDSDGATITTEFVVEDGTTLTGTFDYLEIAQTLKMPEDASFISVVLVISEPASLTGTIGFDDFRVFLEPGPVGTLYDQQTDVVGPEVFTTRMVISPLVGVGLTSPETVAERSLSLRCSSYGASTLTFQLAPLKDAVASWRLNLPKGRLELGSGLVSSATDAEIPRITTDFAASATNRYTLLWHMDNAGTQGDVRLYVSDAPNITGRSGNSLVFTHNAYWESGVGWEYDTSSSNGMRFEISQTGLYVETKEASATSPWTDDDWDDGTEAFDLLSVVRSAAMLSQVSIPRGTVNLGNDLIGSAAECVIPRIATNYPVYTTGQYTLQWEMVDAANGRNIRVYTTQQGGVDYIGTPGFVFTYNASWDGSQWEYDDSASVATRFEVHALGISVYRKTTSGTSPWNDGDWVETSESSRAFQVDQFITGETLLTADNGRLFFAETDTYTNPVYSTATQANALYAKNICKAFLRFELTASSAPSEIDGFNMETGTIGVFLPMTFNTAMFDENYSIISGVDYLNGTTMYFPMFINHTGSGFNVAFFKFSTSNLITRVDADTVDGSFSLAVFGRQDS